MSSRVMKALGLLLLIDCLITFSQAKIYSRCKLARRLEHSGMDKFRGYSLENWLCVAYYESGFDTEAQNTLEDGSTAYGIFQIDSRIWCKNDEEPSKNRCHISCSDLLNDDISDDIMCAKKIVKETESMDYWDSWKIHCEDKDLSEWIEGCNDN
ncbi:lysozyme-like protein 1 [Ornithorhynchus anatinus]|uniref:Glycosyl hydrolases family 22 (GH22) domain-containing protein n=1 Tax=Ornithorhynchus anatinus TaxID=9258 RepID=F6QKJ9_ORNAN|nr:lysozyme-like protein 1 [Ornithorhynchus anatinus]XP_007665972.1 lysozyme-like protein 1 [Ornithorhynchus anatinus]XP_028933191.1 lysozyme-like protein 1 [Ornithorhynchus anatinus]